MEVVDENEPLLEGQETVVKSNRLVKAKTPFTKLEHRVVASLISQIDRDQESFGIQRVSLRQIIERAGVSSTEIFRKAREICDRLVEKSVGICTYDEDRGRVYTAYTLFRQCRYVEQEGAIEAKFEEEMRPLLLRLKNRFTMYSLNCFLRLPSRHSMRVYELLKMREDLGAMRISVEEFRETLGLENSYDRFTDLRRYVIEKARRQVAECTDIEFTYRVEREGRAAEGLRFFITRNGEDSGKPEERLPAAQTDVNVDTGSERALRFDVKTWFLKGLTQEEVHGLSDETLETLHEAARTEAKRRHPDAKRSVLASETLRRMEEKWATRRS
jgi:plasmid replication initiation protein